MATTNLPSLAPRTFDDAIKFSEMLAKSDFVPKAFQGKPGDILAAIQMGYEVGLAPMAALQNIAVINGRPSMWGDALLAIVQASGLLETIDESDDGKTATCRVKRKGDPTPRVSTFSMDDASRAALAGKQGPWQQYPKRMRQMRARSFALRDKFADVLKGLIAREEAIDITPTDEPAQQLDLGALSEEETPRAAETVELVMDEAPVADADFAEADGMKAEAVMEIINIMDADKPATPAEQEAFKLWVNGRKHPQDIKAIQAMKGWTDVAHATKRQIQAAREMLEKDV